VSVPQKRKKISKPATPGTPVDPGFLRPPFGGVKAAGKVTLKYRNSKQYVYPLFIFQKTYSKPPGIEEL